MSSLSKGSVFATLGLDSYVPKISSFSFNNFQADISPGNLIYMIYLETEKYSIHLEIVWECEKSELFLQLIPEHLTPFFLPLWAPAVHMVHIHVCKQKKKNLTHK